MGKSSFLQVLKNSGFSTLWSNQILMQLALNTLNFALILWVYKLTGSNFAVSALILSFYLPALLFGIFAGVLIDLTDRKKVIILTDLLFSICLFLFVFIKDFYPLILINAFLINTLSQFFIPAESSSIPLLVKKKELFFANSLFSLTLYGSFMLGYTLAGPTLNYFGISAIFYFSSAALFLGFLLVQRLPKLKATKKEGLRKFVLENGFDRAITETFSEIKGTFEFIRGKLPVAASIAILSAIQGVIGILAVIIASYTERVLKVQATDASFIVMLPLGLGMTIGALLVGKLFHNKPRRLIVIPAIINCGILLFITGALPSLAKFFNSFDLPEQIPTLRYFFEVPSLSSTFMVGAFLLGVSTVAIIIPSQTILQEQTNNKNRGKIFAVLFALMNAFAIIPVILAGALADIFGETVIFLSLGVIIFIIGILALKPSLFFSENSLSFKIREFLGLGHWESDVS